MSFHKFLLCMNRLCPLDLLTSSEPQQAAVHSWTLDFTKHTVMWTSYLFFHGDQMRKYMSIYMYISIKRCIKTFSLSCSERQKQKYCECSWRLCTHCFDQYFWKQYNLYIKYCFKFVMSIIKVLFFCFDCIPLNIQYN